MVRANKSKGYSRFQPILHIQYIYDVLVFLSHKGCLVELKDWFERNFLTTGIAVIILCVMEVRLPPHTLVRATPPLLADTQIMRMAMLHWLHSGVVEAFLLSNEHDPL